MNCDPTPNYFSFLEADDNIVRYHSPTHRDLVSALDACIVVDISDWKRLGDLGKTIRKFGIPIGCVDHHIPTDLHADVHLSDQTASSTGELLYDFLNWVKADFDQSMLNALYTCILTDTGSFRFANTTSRTHEIVADLLRRGAAFRTVYERVYESYSPNRAKLTGHLLVNMQFNVDGQLAWFVLSQELLNQYNVETWEIEGLSELPRSIADVQISMMFMELIDGRTKVSFRSRGNVAVHQLAGQFGGGGHPFAAGAMIEKSPDRIVAKVVQAAKTLLSR